MHHFNCSTKPTFRFHINGYNEHKIPLLCHDEGGILFWGKPFSHNNKSQNVQHKCPVYVSDSNPKGLITRKICAFGDPNEKPSSKCALNHDGPCITHAPNAQLLLRRAREAALAAGGQRSSTKRKSEERYLQRKRHKKNEPKIEIAPEINENVYFSTSSDDDLLISSDSLSSESDDLGPKKSNTRDRNSSKSSSPRRLKEVSSSEELNFVDDLLRRAEKNLVRHLFYVSLYQYRQCLSLAKSAGIINQARKGEQESLNKIQKRDFLEKVV